MTARRTPLPSHIKRYIVMALARHDTPLEVAARVLHEFDLQLSRSTVQMYDPTTHGGRKLSEELTCLFKTTRKNFETEIEQVPISHRATRLRRLEFLYNHALGKQNLKIATTTLREARAEMAAFEVVDDEADDATRDTEA
jgi:hypothetical protein